MKLSRSPLVLALILCLFASADLDQASAGLPLSPPVGTITSITEPAIRQVVQRRDDNWGNILFVGKISGYADGFQARSLLRPGMAGKPQNWTSLIDVTISEGGFIGIFRQPAGGFYDLQIRPVFKGWAGAAVTVFAVGVGEVFITAGQSNTTNGGDPTGYVPDLRVSAFVDGPQRGIDPSYPGSSWQWGLDPQPTIDETTGGSVWPTMASNLASALNVPIGIYSVGCGGSSIDQWLPGVATPPTLLTPQVILFNRLTNALNYFKVRSGVRAVLWEQGETDFLLGTSPVVYQADLTWIIEQSRSVTGVPVKWMVAQATSPLATNPTLRTQLERAQANVTDGVATFLGPNTDLLGTAWRRAATGSNDVHFNAAGVELLGDFWGIYVFSTPSFLGPGYLPAP